MVWNSKTGINVSNTKRKPVNLFISWRITVQYFQIYYSNHAAVELGTVLEIEQTRLTMTSRLITSFYGIIYKQEYHSMLSARMHIWWSNSWLDLHHHTKWAADTAWYLTSFITARCLIYTLAMKVMWNGWKYPNRALAKIMVKYNNLINLFH